MPINSIHSKNVNSFDRLINFCVIHRQRYNPINKSITEAALLLKQAEVVLSIQNVRATKNTFNSVMAQLKQACADSKRLSKQMVKALETSGSLQQSIDKAKSILHHMQSKSTRKTGDQKIQQSYDAIIDNFASLLETILADPLYNPSEEHLKKTALQNKLDEVHAINLWLMEVSNIYMTAHIERNNSMYHPQTGLVALAEKAKEYILSLFDSNSLEYKKVDSFKFVVPHKDKQQ